MLEIRPICENCNKALPPHSEEAMICSFECTFCRSCVENVLENVCPNFGGGFCLRPIRPAMNWKGDNYLGVYRPSATAGIVRWPHIFIVSLPNRSNPFPQACVEI
jgi:hypothetical protein